MANSTYPSFTEISHPSPYPDISPNNPSLSATGKVILITGGGTGIGKAIATAFSEARAAVVILIGRTEAHLKVTQAELSLVTTTKVDYFVADITDQVTFETAFSTAFHRYGKVDVLVNNAGYLSVHTSLAKSPLEDYWRGFEINIKGPIITTQAFMKIAQAGATIINVSSGAAHISYIEGFSGYSAAKLATIKIMEYVQHENPELRVFNINPGFIETNMAKASGLPTEIFDESGLPGAFCVWLASPESDFLKGRFLWASWDVKELKAKSEMIKARDLLTIKLSGWPLGSN
ncbi:NAD(P)-binding protein [Stipitochalara longipes BDJ]|nr:NAD(P)-binding protein [Stipitochalara longipes BDJ]